MSYNNDPISTRNPGFFFLELRNKSVWYPFGLCLATMVFQQWSGVNAIIFNTVTIFNAANVSIDQYLATNIVGLVQLIATFSKIPFQTNVLVIEFFKPGVDPTKLRFSSFSDF